MSGGWGGGVRFMVAVGGLVVALGGQVVAAPGGRGIVVMVLRLSHAVSAGRHRVSAELEGLEGRARQTAAAEFGFVERPDDGEGIRWYLEDFLEFPGEPAPLMAARVEDRLAGIGVELFAGVFGSRDGQRLWYQAQERLEQVRVEVASDPGIGVGLPWELLRDPVTDVAVALRARSFVRLHPQPAQPVRLPDSSGIATGSGADRLRVLLVICRPAGGEDVPFRSVASHLVRGDAVGQISGLDLDVLRPPTFAQLSKVLRAAARAGQPYHVVHFDGHGAYLDLAENGDDSGIGETVGRGDGGSRVSPDRYATVSPVRPGRHGYLLFERPDATSNQELVDGPTLGGLLAETGVPVLVLNACRSAYNEPVTPHTDSNTTDSATADGAASAGEISDLGSDPGLAGTDGAGVGVHARVRAYGSLAAEVADAGVPGVVAMRYNVYVVTAAQFVAELYAGLLQGRGLGEAVSDARRHLAADPQRQIGQRPAVGLQDWPVPVVFESAPLTLFTPVAPSGVGGSGEGWVAPVAVLTAPEQPDQRAGGDAGTVLPRRPDAGFHGRDATLLTVDRAFDSHRVVLVHALAGAGKTTTVAEFARWYAETGGLDTGSGASGPVLFTTFEQYRTLPHLLAQFGELDPQVQDQTGKVRAWQTLSVAEQRQVAVQFAGQVPLLWIWDNVEPVTGFPAGAPTPWTAAEQAELLEFLRDLATTRARVVLTSRREEQPWLGELPVRVPLPAMPMRERFALAQALAAHQPDPAGRPRVLNSQDWRPLLNYSGGNPMTVTVLVGQALQRGLTSRQQLAGFVTELSEGRTAPETAQDRALGRSASLAASLDYGFSHAFTDPERAQLAVLHLFRGAVDADALAGMGAGGSPHQVPALAELTREQAITLLDRAAQIGLLTALGGGHYTIHPALPWYFTTLFQQAYGPPDSPPAVRAARAYTTTLGQFGNYYHNQSKAGHHEVIDALAVEEDNLLHALQLARTHHDWPAATSAAQGLYTLYDHQGRAVEWARIVDQLTTDLIDPATDQPRPGTDSSHHSLITGYRVRIAQNARDWDTATRLQDHAIAWHRQQAGTALETPPDRLDNTARNRIRSLAVTIEDLGHLLNFQGDPDCLRHYQQAIELFRRIHARQEEANLQLSVGIAYFDIPQLRDLDRAAQAYQTSLDLRPDHDTLGRARALGELATVDLERFHDALRADADPQVLLDHLNHALAGHHRSLDLLPDPHPARAIAHNQLGNIYDEAGDTGQALTHYQHSIRNDEQAGNTYSAGHTRYNIAVMLYKAGRRDDALDWAHAALRDYLHIGPGATHDITQTQQFIQHIQQTTNN